MHPTWPSLTPTSTRRARGARLSFLRSRHTVGSFRACGCRLFCPTLPPSPAKDCACRLSRADPRLQSSQHPLRLRKRYVRSVGALAGLASLRHPRGRASWRVRRTADAPLTHCCHPPVQHSCAGVRHATCDMRVVGAVPVVCARLLPRLRESTFRPSLRLAAKPLCRADPRLQPSQHLISLRTRYMHSVGALVDLASRRHKGLAASA